MIKSIKLTSLSLCLLLCAAVLFGCSSKVEFEAGRLPADADSISIVLAPGETALLDEFTDLRQADFSGSAELDEIMAWAELNPEVKVSFTVPLPDGSTVPRDAESLDLSAFDGEQLDEILNALGYMPNISFLSLGSGFDCGDLAAISAGFPHIQLDFSKELFGLELSPMTERLELGGMGSEEASLLTGYMPFMTMLSRVDLGSDELSRFSWEDIAAMEEAAPEAEFSYSFSLYGTEHRLNDSVLDLNHIPISDNGQLVAKIVRCMPELIYLDMDSCGVRNEYMEQIRDSLPNTEVVWRIWFGNYSVRTDVERILASNPGLGGNLTEENVMSLKYCTKVKYLDMGHNRSLDTIEFVSYMPELEVAILAMNAWSDAGPLANCPKLEYLEIFETALNDVSPLAGLKNLKHLNIATCYALHDVRPLFELTGLERLWIGYYNFIPPQQLTQLREALPKCNINTTSAAPLGETWRFMGPDEFGINHDNPRYVLLRQQLDYGNCPAAYCYYWNDPLCPGPDPFADPEHPLTFQYD